MYKDGYLLNLSTILVNAGAELLSLHEEYDTVIIINVLEHVQVLGVGVPLALERVSDHGKRVQGAEARRDFYI